MKRSRPPRPRVKLNRDAVWESGPAGHVLERTGAPELWKRRRPPSPPSRGRPNQGLHSPPEEVQPGTGPVARDALVCTVIQANAVHLNHPDGCGHWRGVLTPSGPVGSDKTGYVNRQEWRYSSGFSSRLSCNRDCPKTATLNQCARMPTWLSSVTFRR